MVAGHYSIGYLLAIAGWMSTGPLDGSDLAARSSRRLLKDTVLDKSRGSGRRPRRHLCRRCLFRRWAGRGALAAVEAVPGVRLVNDETRLIPEAKPFVWSAERERSSGSRYPAVRRCRRAKEIAGGGPCGSRRRRGGRSDEFVAGGAAAFRQCGAALARPGFGKLKGRQDHDFG